MRAVPQDRNGSRCPCAAAVVVRPVPYLAVRSAQLKVEARGTRSDGCRYGCIYSARGVGHQRGLGRAAERCGLSTAVEAIEPASGHCNLRLPRARETLGAAQQRERSVASKSLRVDQLGL